MGDEACALGAKGYCDDLRADDLRGCGREGACPGQRADTDAFIHGGVASLATLPSHAREDRRATRWLHSTALRSSLLRRAVAARRSSKVIREYLRVRERYAGATVGTLSASGDATSRALLWRRWKGPRRRLDDVRSARVFCVLPLLETASPIIGELQRNFDVQVFDLTPYLPRDPRELTASRRAVLQRDIVTAFRSAEAEHPVDLVWMYVSSYQVDPTTLTTIAESGVPVAVLSMDDKHAFEERPVGIPNGQRALIGAATVHLTTSIECKRWYAGEGAAAYYFPEAADPEIFRPLNLPKDIDVSFVGGWYGARRDLIMRLQAVGIRVECFGPGTENGALTREEMVRVFNRTRVNLGFGGIGETEAITHLKGRDFEIPMSGNAYLTLFDHELATHFTIGEEVACYRNAIDCAEQVRMLLEDTARRDQVAERGRRRALHDHTWTRRLEDLVTWLQIAPGSGA